MKLLKKNAIPFTATAICSAQQALIAAAAGADYVAPYVNRADDVNINGVEVTETSDPLASGWKKFTAFVLKIVPESQL